MGIEIVKLAARSGRMEIAALAGSWVPYSAKAVRGHLGSGGPSTRAMRCLPGDRLHLRIPKWGCIGARCDVCCDATARDVAVPCRLFLIDPEEDLMRREVARGSKAPE